MNKDNHVFESVIHITKERDTQSLVQALLRTVADFTDFNTLTMLRKLEESDEMEVTACLPTTANQKDTGITHCEFRDKNVHPDDFVRLCLNSAELVTVENNGATRMLFPIILNGAVTNVLDIQCKSPQEDTQKIIHGFTRIYSNFLTILHDNEHDTLTGLLNRKTFDLRLTELISASASTTTENEDYNGEERRTVDEGTHNWVGVLDIDHFKSINDNYGHLFGDEVLLLFSNHLKKTFRSSDLLFRYGGEEFVVVLSPVTEINAVNAFERFRKAIESFDFPQVGRVTVSIGIVKMESHDHYSTVLEHADLALYYAKDHGRNQVCNYHQLLNDGEIKDASIVDDFEMF